MLLPKQIPYLQQDVGGSLQLALCLPKFSFNSLILAVTNGLKMVSHIH
jgi:hypothetical protein